MKKVNELFDVAVELDENYFDSVRKEKHGQETADKVLVFGLLKRGGKVHALRVPDPK